VTDKDTEEGRTMTSGSKVGILGVAILGGVLAISQALRAQEKVTVRGEVVDLSCYLVKGEKGPGHRTCAQMCAKGGLPIGLLSSDGVLYVLLSEHDNPGPYEAAKGLAGENAEIGGKKFTRNGVPSIAVETAKGL